MISLEGKRACFDGVTHGVIQCSTADDGRMPRIGFLCGEERVTSFAYIKKCGAKGAVNCIGCLAHPEAGAFDVV